MRKLLFQEPPPRRRSTEPAPAADDAALAELAAARRAALRAAGSAAASRSAQVDAGSCNGCELEIHALNNAFYDIERFGFRFVASPRHADVLLVTGPVTQNMREALKRTYDATPARNGWSPSATARPWRHVFAGCYAVQGGVAAVLPVDLQIAGCPPTPLQLLEALLALLETAARRT